MKYFFIAILAVCFFATEAFAQFTQQINYQGKLTDNTGATVTDGDYEITYRLYDAETGGSLLFTEVATSTLTSGLFSYMVGSSTSLSSVDFNQPLYLSIEVNGDGEMTPRKRLGAVPAAFEASNAQTLDNIATSSFLRSDESDDITAASASTLLTITQNGAGDILNLFDDTTEVFSVISGGNIGVGTTSPTYDFSVDGDVIVTGAFYDSSDSAGVSGYVLQTTAAGTQWVATSSLGLGNIFGNTINANELANEDFGSFSCDGAACTIDSGAVDISSMTNLSVGASGLALSGDEIVLAGGYNIPLTASTTNWNAFYDTPSTQISAGTGLSWSTNTLNVDDDYVLNTGDVVNGDLDISGTTTVDTLVFAAAGSNLEASEILIGSGNGSTQANALVFKSRNDFDFILDSNANTGDANTEFSIFNEATSTEALFTVEGDGTIGIGSSTPSEKLTVIGGAYFGGNVTATGTLDVQGTGTSTVAGGIEITGSIVPSVDDTYSLGAPDKVWRDVYIGPGSLYVNGKKVLQDISDTITFSTDADQNLVSETSGAGTLIMRATGSGNVTATSDSGNININSSSGNLNIGTTGSGQLNFGTITAGTWNGDAIDISSYTNLGVTATGLELSGDDVALSSGYVIPLSASTTNWNAFYDTPSTQITAGNNIDWSGNTLNVTGVGDGTFLGLSDTPGSYTTNRIPYMSGSAITTSSELTFDGSQLIVGGSNVNDAVQIGSVPAITLYAQGNASSRPDILLNSNGVVAAENSLRLNIDSDNSGTSDNFIISHNASTSAATELVRINESAQLSFNGDTDTYLARPVTDELAFTVAGSEAMRIDSSGNIGIGTTTPSGLLHVYSGASGASIPSGADDFIIENSGDDVGMSIVSDASNDARIILGDSTDSSSGIVRWDNTEDEFVIGTGIGGGELVFNTGNSVERMRIDNNGYVGVGTTTPQALLTIGDGVMSTVNGTDDLYVTDDVEIDGALYVAGNSVFDGQLTAAAFNSEVDGHANLRGDASVVIDLDDDNDGSNFFRIRDGADADVFIITEAGIVSSGTWNGTIIDEAYLDTDVSLLGADINVTELASEDFGDFTCNGTTCSVDTDALGTAEIQDVYVLNTGDTVTGDLTIGSSANLGFGGGSGVLTETGLTLGTGYGGTANNLIMGGNSGTAVVLDVNANDTVSAFRVHNEATSTTALFTVTDEGTVGIGVAAPTALLEIATSTTATGTDLMLITSGAGSSLVTDYYDTGDYRIYNNNQDNGIVFKNSTGGIEFQYNGSTVAAVDSNGGFNIQSGGLHIGDTEVVTSGREIQNVTFANDLIDPDDILSGGQVDEYCLTYETTGDTWEWADCSATSVTLSGLSDTSVGSAAAGDVLMYDGSTWVNTSTSTLITETEIDTSSELAVLLGDETGTGNVVFSADPTFTGTVTGADLVLSGIATTTGLVVETSGTPDVLIGSSAGSSQDAILRLRGARTTSDSSELAQIRFENNGGGSGSAGLEIARITADNDDTTDDTSLGRLQFFTTNSSEVLTERMRIDSDGNVGIGTSSPASMLDVWGSLTVGTSSTPALFVDVANSQVGIGKANPNVPLDVETALGTVGLRVDAASGSGDARIFIDGDGDGVFYAQDTASETSLYLSSGGNSYLNGGNVGIGTSSPSAMLTIGDGVMSTVNGTDDLYVTDDVEVDGSLYVALSSTFDAEVAAGGFSGLTDAAGTFRGDTNIFMDLDEDNDGSGSFQIRDGANTSVFIVNESGQVTTGTWNGTIIDEAYLDTDVSLLGADINVTELASEDFGDFTCNGTTCSVDTDALGTAEIQDVYVLNTGDTVTGDLTIGSSAIIDFAGSDGVLSTARSSLTMGNGYGGTNNTLLLGGLSGTAVVLDTNTNDDVSAFRVHNEATSTTALFTVTDEGTVGIGVAAPTTTLHVADGGSVGTDIATFEGASDALIVEYVSEGDYGILNTQQRNGVVVYDGTNGVSIFYNDTEQIEIDSNSGLNIVTGDFEMGGTQVISSGLEVGNVTFANDLIDPDDILSGGQVDEYCLTYETTGDTWEWADCSATSVTLSGLSDTSVGSAAAGDVLMYDGSTWVNTSTSTLITETEIDTSSELAVLLGDETGTGSAVFSDGAAFTGDVTFEYLTDGTSTSSDFFSSEGRIAIDGFITTTGILNQGETGSSPAAIVFGNGATEGTDEISFITNGNTRTFIDSAGDTTFDSGTLFVDAVNNRVGIGTTSPLALLTVGAGVPSTIDGTDDLYVTNDIEAAGALYLDGVANADVFKGLTDQNAILRGDTNVVIDLDNDNDGSNVLNVRDGADATVFQIDETGAITLGVWNGTEVDDAYISDTITASNYLPLTGGALSGNLSFSGSAANIQLGTNYISSDGNDEGISIDANGDVGIGTSTSPFHRFEVWGKNQTDNDATVAIYSDNDSGQDDRAFEIFGVDDPTNPTVVESVFIVRGDGTIATGTWNGTIIDEAYLDTDVSLLGADINVTELASEDFGDFTCNGTTCSVDTDALGTAEIQDVYVLNTGDTVTGDLTIGSSANLGFGGGSGVLTETGLTLGTGYGGTANNLIMGGNSGTAVVLDVNANDTVSAFRVHNEATSTTALFTVTDEGTVGIGVAAPTALLTVGAGVSGTVDGTDDLFVTDDIELDGTIYGAEDAVFDSQLAIGTTIDANRIVNIAGTLTGDATSYGVTNLIDYAGTMTGGINVNADFNRLELEGFTTNGNTLNGNAVQGVVRINDGNEDTGTTRALYGVGQNQNTTGINTALYGVESSLTVDANATTTTGVGFRSNLTNNGQIDTYYGMHIVDVVEGGQTSAYAIWANEGDIVLDADGDGLAGTPTDAQGDLFFGEAQDAAIWYDAADLNIDPDIVGSGVVRIGGDLAVGGGSAVQIFDTNNVATGPDVLYASSALVGADDSYWITIDADNGTTNGFFTVATDAQTSSANRLFTILETGEVGIGVTAPSATLDIQGSTTVGTDIVSIAGDSDAMVWNNFAGGDYSLLNSQQSNGINFYDGTGGVRIQYNGTEVVEIDSTGGLEVKSGGLTVDSGGATVAGDADFDSGTLFVDVSADRVGIGTTTPSYSLAVAGDIYATGGIVDSSGSLGANGMILQTDGTNATWVATSSLGVGDGTFLGLSDTPGSYTANQIPYMTASGLTTDAGLAYDGDTLSVDQNITLFTPTNGMSLIENNQYDLGLASRASLELTSDTNDNSTTDNILFGTNGTSSNDVNWIELARITDSGELSFNGDTDTYLARPATNELAFTVGGTEALRIDAGGQVGVGTSTLSQQFTVAGADSGNGIRMVGDRPALRFQEDDTTDQNFQIQLIDGDLQIGTNVDAFSSFAYDVHFDAGGNLGIGDNSPSSLLNVGNGDISTADGTDDLFVTDDIELDGSLYGAENMDIDGYVAFGSAGSPDSNYLINAQHAFNADAALRGMYINMLNTQTLSANRTSRGIQVLMQADAIDENGFNADFRGIESEIQVDGSSSLNDSFSFFANLDNNSTGVVDNYSGFYVAYDNTAGTTTTTHGLYVADIVGEGNQTAGYAIKVDEGDIWLDADGDGLLGTPTNNQGDIFLGEGGDAAIYYDGTDLIADPNVEGDGSFDVRGNFGVGVDTIQMFSTNSIASNPDILFANSGLIAGEDNVYITIDADSSGTGANFIIANNASTSAATQIFVVNESGQVTTGEWNSTAIDELYLDANVVLDTEIDTSSELAGILTDETGSGAAVFATSPTLVTPVLGVADATEINFTNQEPSDLSADGDVGFDSSRGIIVYRTQQVGQETGNGGYTVLDTSNITGGTNLTITNTASGTSGTEAITFNVDDAFLLNSGDTATGEIIFADDTNLTLGSDSDWQVQYDEGVDDQLLFVTTNTAAVSISDPMVQFLVGTTPTENQDVFGVAKGTQGSNTDLFTVDEDGDGVFTGNARMDYAIGFADSDMQIRADTDIFLDLDNDNDGSEFLYVRDGANTNVFAINESGQVTIGEWNGTAIDAAYISDSFLLNNGDTATGDYTFDTSTLVIDATNNFVGVGTSSPSFRFVAGVDAGESMWVAHNDGTSFWGDNITDSEAAVKIYADNDDSQDDHALEIFGVDNPDDKDVSSASSIFVIKSDGSVGIGDSDPSKLLAVSGGFGVDSSGNASTTGTFESSNTDGIILSNSAASMYFDSENAPDGLPFKRITSNDGGGNWNFRAGGYYDSGLKYAVTGDGYAGLEFNIESNDSIALEVATASAAAGNDITIAGSMTLDASSAHALFENIDIKLDVDGDGASGGSGGDLLFGEGQDAAMWYDGTNLQINPRLTGSGSLLLPSGNLGIGSSTPSHPLSVLGATNNVMASFYLDSSGAGYIHLGNTDETWRVGYGSAENFNIGDSATIDIFKINNGAPSSAIEITSAGNVGISDTSPSALLNVGTGDAAVVDGTNDLFVTDDIEAAGNLVIGLSTPDIATDTGDIFASADIEADGSIYIGSNTADIIDGTEDLFVTDDIEVDGDARIEGHLALANGAINTQRALNINETYTSDSNVYGIYNQVTYNSAMTSSRNVYGTFSQVISGTPTTNSNNLNLYGVAAEAQVNDDTDGANAVRAGYSIVDNNNISGTVASAYGLEARIDNISGGDITNAYGLYPNLVNAGTIDTYYGIFIPDAFEGTQTNAYSLWTNEGDIIIDEEGDGVAGGTSGGGDLFFGNTQDAALWYGGSNLIIDPDVSATGGDLYVLDDIHIRTDANSTSPIRFYNNEDISTSPDIEFQTSALISAEDQLYISIDDDNDGTTNSFIIQKDATTSAGTELFRVAETGKITVTSNQTEGGGVYVAEFFGDSDSLAIENSSQGDYTIMNTGQDNGIFIADGTGGVRIEYAGSAVLQADSSGGVEVVSGGIDVQAGGMTVTGDADFDTSTLFVDVSQNNVGVGTSSPLGKLTVFSTGGSSGDGLRIQNDYDQVNMFFDGTGDDTQFVLNYANSGGDDLIFQSNGDIGMADASGGNLGVGTTSPVTKLHIETDSPVFTIYDTDNTLTDAESAGKIQFLQNDNGGNGVGADIEVVGNGSAGLVDMVFSTGGNGSVSEAMRIRNDGHIGMGDTDPTIKLSLSDSSSSFIASFVNSNGANGADGIIIQAGDADPGTGAEIIEFRNSSGSAIDTIEGDGAGATRYTGNAAGTYSDRRVKENILDYTDDAIAVLESFRPVTFNYIAGPNASSTRTGFIAQEVLSVYPQAVNFGDDLSGIAEEDLPRLRLNYGELTPILTAAVQDITTIIDLSAASTTQTAMAVTASGTIAIGTTTATAQLTTDGSVRFATFGAGTLQTDALGNLMVSSDERLKDIAANYEPGLEEVLAIEPIEYSWKAETGFDTEGTYVGFSAQNVELVLPDAVSYDKNGFRTLSDRTILAAVINAIEDMWTQVTGNENRIEELEAENEALKARLDMIESALDIDPVPTPTPNPTPDPDEEPVTPGETTTSGPTEPAATSTEPIDDTAGTGTTTDPVTDEDAGAGTSDSETTSPESNTETTVTEEVTESPEPVVETSSESAIEESAPAPESDPAVDSAPAPVVESNPEPEASPSA